MKVVTMGSTLRLFPDDLTVTDSIPVGTYQIQFWDDYSDWVGEDTYYYLYIITDKECLEYEIVHESTFVRSIERVVKIEFLN